MKVFKVISLTLFLMLISSCHDGKRMYLEDVNPIVMRGCNKPILCENGCMKYVLCNECASELALVSSRYDNEVAYPIINDIIYEPVFGVPTNEKCSFVTTKINLIIESELGNKSVLDNIADASTLTNPKVVINKPDAIIMLTSKHSEAIKYMEIIKQLQQDNWVNKAKAQTESKTGSEMPTNLNPVNPRSQTNPHSMSNPINVYRATRIIR